MTATPSQFTYTIHPPDSAAATVSPTATATGTGDTAYIGTCELQILDDPAPQYAKLDPRQYCCSIYGVVPAKTGYLRPVGEWNSEHVIVKGHTIQVELNGYVVVDADVTTVKEYMHGSKHPGLDANLRFVWICRT